MGISFLNSSFVINGTKFCAYQANFTESSNFQRVDELGYSSVRTVSSSRPNGNFSVDFYLDEKSIAFTNLTGLVPFTGGVSGIGFNTGFMSEFSISAEPLSVIKASIKGSFFERLNRDIIPFSADHDSIDGISHGAASSVGVDIGDTSIYSNQNLFSINLSFTQNISPRYKAGSIDLLGYDYEGGEIKCTLNGTGLQRAVDFLCQDETNIVLNLKNVCNTSLGDIEVKGLKVVNSSVTINEEEDVVGSLELIRYF